MHFWKRACSENWQIIVQWPGGDDHCSSFIMQILRCLQKCGKLKMMAVVRTSLQKVVVLLHRLQRMAVSSPRYQKLCKVTEWLKMRILGVWQFCFSVSKTNPCQGSHQGEIPFVSNWLWKLLKWIAWLNFVLDRNKHSFIAYFILQLTKSCLLRRARELFGENMAKLPSLRPC